MDHEPVAQAINSMISTLDELMVKATQPHTFDEIEAIGIGQIMTRCQLILSFIEARKSPKLKVISHG